MSALRRTVCIEIIKGPHQGLKNEIPGHVTVIIGRASSAQLRLDKDPHFSRHHFRLEVNPPKALLVDLKSRNGTFVNGQRVTERYLEDGDIISGGKTEIRVSITGPRIDADPPSAERTLIGQVGGEGHADSDETAAIVIPGFELLDRLGQGAMGVVYRAAEKGTGRIVAIKVFSPMQVAGEEGMQLFLRESSILSQLNHPRIVQFDRVGIHDRRMYLVMEHVDQSATEDSLLSPDAKPSLRVCCGVVCEVLEGLHFAHTRGIVHRDVKPSNFLLYRKGRRLHVKLADFGLAKNFLLAGMSSITGEGEVRGALGYMPPEQIYDCRFAKPTCDIYAAASTLFFLLSGQYPYAFETLSDILLAKLEQDPRSLLEVRPELPDELARILDDALSRNPAKRPQSAAVFRDQLLPFRQRR